MSEPTPRPWELDPNGPRDIFTTSTGELVASTYPMGDDEDYEIGTANAAHIVRCVNAHDALVEALEKIANHCGPADYCINIAQRALDALEEK